MAKVKNHKMDPYLVSNQPWEIKYIADKFKLSTDLVRKVKKEVGRSRQKIYNELRKWHYTH